MNFQEGDSILPSLYQQYIHISRYSRWRDDLKRRETWEETVNRFCSFFDTRLNGKFHDVIYNELKPAILGLEIMPSMRALMAAGPALERDHIAGYNCSYIAVDNKRAFSEAMYILLCGTGLGFSCERQEISKLPIIPEILESVDDVIVVADSKLGWAKAFRKLLSSLWEGDIPKIDYSFVRPAGARLKTFGGRASGPEPLRRLFNYTIGIFKGAVGRKLTSLEVHDIMCMIGDVVVVGGVRRSALISLSNLSDQRMRDAKSGQWWIENGQRALANNSVAYTEKPSIEIFMEEWLALVKSKSGERGIINRGALQKQAGRWGRRSSTANYGVNPCCEIILLNKEFCNLTEVVIRATDTFETLRRKVRLATIIGTMQATLTDFKFISEDWKTNCEKERLLGVSLTGIMDNPMMCGANGKKELEIVLNGLRDTAREVNAEWAEKLDIAPSAAITCVKPSGTVSQLVNSSSGIHSRYAQYYLRTVRNDKKDPLYKFLKESGVYCEDAQGKEDNQAVFYFPIKSPEGSITRNDLTAIEQLELWLIYQRQWCEHKPSVSVYVKDQEWLEVGAWVYKHFDEISGISFFPYSDHVYAQAPYQEITKEDYETWIKDHPMPTLDWLNLKKYEKEDNTIAQQTLACSAGICEI